MVPLTPPSTGSDGKAWLSEGIQSNCLAGTRSATGASRGQSHRAGIRPRSTFTSAARRAGAASRAYRHRASGSGSLGVRSAIGRANSSGPR